MLADAAAAAGPLPQGGHFVAGFGSIVTQGRTLTVSQPGTLSGVIDWNSFSIGKGNTVTFDNGGGTTLNRVTGGSPSALFGSLTATGTLYLINPQGVLVGRSGVISTGGRFVASTLDLPNTAFMNGGSLALAGASHRKVVNLGRISSSGGDVFLIAGDAVVNAGSVSAPNGTAEFVAGQKVVVLSQSTSGRQVLVQIGSRGTVVDKGITQAAQINLEAADGNIYALAGSGSRIRATGTTTRDGHVWLIAEKGHATQQGTVTASNADGTGGTVDTLANTLTLSNDAAVHAGLWNVSTPSFTVDTGTAAVFRRSLNAGTSIDATAAGTNGASGDMTVASSIVWTGPASLSVAALHNVTIARSATIANTGSGNLNLRADAAGLDNGGSVVNHGTIDWSGSLGAVSSFYDINGSYSPGTILANCAWTSSPYSGLVTQVSAYKLVNSLADLRHVAADLAGNYALGKDIDASPTSDGSYAPLGDTVTPFTGQFDGQGHSIRSLTLQAWFPADVYAPPLMGMFGEIGNKGVVRNLNVDGTIASAPSSLFYCCAQGDLGILAAINQGTVVGVNASGSINSGAGGMAQDYTTAGGLLGVNGGKVLRSSSSVSLVTGQVQGGLVGENDGLIQQSFSTGPVESLSYINIGGGGLVGGNAGTIKQSYSTSPTTLDQYCRGGYNPNCGGAAFVVVNSGTISQSFATGLTQNGEYERVGIARENDGTITNDVYWNKETTGAAVGVNAGTPMPASNGLTTAQMSMPASFVGYDFGPTGVWAMPAGATHPVLRWQPGL